MTQIRTAIRFKPDMRGPLQFVFDQFYMSHPDGVYEKAKIYTMLGCRVVVAHYTADTAFCMSISHLSVPCMSMPAASAGVPLLVDVKPSAHYTLL